MLLRSDSEERIFQECIFQIQNEKNQLLIQEIVWDAWIWISCYLVSVLLRLNQFCISNFAVEHGVKTFWRCWAGWSCSSAVIRGWEYLKSSCGEGSQSSVCEVVLDVLQVKQGAFAAACWPAEAIWGWQDERKSVIFCMLVAVGWRRSCESRVLFTNLRSSSHVLHDCGGTAAFLCLGFSSRNPGPWARLEYWLWNYWVLLGSDKCTLVRTVDLPVVAKCLVPDEYYWPSGSVVFLHLGRLVPERAWTLEKSL